MDLKAIVVREANEIDPALADFARDANGGLVVTIGALAQTYRDRIIGLAARYQLPAIYPFRSFVVSGGLISYGPKSVEQFRHAASYVGRILKGEKAAELPVQQPTMTDLAINRRTANVLGLTIPPALVARADEVIE